MTTRHVTLQNQSSANISFADISNVAQALQIQIDRDFGPAWGVHAQITALQQGAAIPPKVWPIKIVDKPVGGLGIHLDKGHKPFAQVKPTPDWSVTASHELLEMLADPFGQRFASAPDIDPTSDGHLVHYLVEVGDPCEIFEYTIGGVAVSDFVLPDYYNAQNAASGEVDFLAQLSGPLDVPQGCYISWIDTQDSRWHQKMTNGDFVRAKARISSSPKINPRDERDAAFGDEEEGRRHDLPAIRSKYRPSVAEMPVRGRERFAVPSAI